MNGPNDYLYSAVAIFRREAIAPSERFLYVTLLYHKILIDRNFYCIEI